MDIRCPECGIYFDYADEVVLDEANTLTHTSCYSNAISFKKDSGKTMDILQKYPFFHKSSPVN
ncbi:hypothetical protein J2Z40_002289 [Cytobacillus eiseniae]|uniref:Uncharacterized protein n=1 Tax=Cytobacillus eiseniae TaxID=762947 RepID=A0ABS4RFN4_9BACI|nr:hypothetical protein [Cytobacillus eiseniae]